MRLFPDRTGGPAFQQRGENFTGLAWGEPMMVDDGVGMSVVYFSPGARTYWHSHKGGQALTITAGLGLVGVRDGSVLVVQAGDVLWTPPGEEHWHGACADSFMVHSNVSVGGTRWLEEVSTEDFSAAHANSRRGGPSPA